MDDAMEIDPSIEIYSGCPKSGRPDFGIFKKRLVPKTSGFQTLRLKTGHKRLKTERLCPVFGHFRLIIYLKSGHNCVRFSARHCM